MSASGKPIFAHRGKEDATVKRLIARALVQREQDRLAVEAAASKATELEEEAQGGPDIEACGAAFLEWLRWWPFKNRETGEVHTFADLWEGQQEAADAMIEHPWLFLLKAGKLGFTELECAWDGWIARFKPNSRVHIYSKDADSAKVILGFVKFGLANIHTALRLPIFEGAGGDTIRSLVLDASTTDRRTIISYASASKGAKTKGTPGIDQTATHVHLDELSHAEDPETLYSDVSTIVPPDGSIHIVTRGRGDLNYTAELWAKCGNNGGSSPMHGYFADWTKRPDRDEEWHAVEAGKRSNIAMNYYAPATAEDALSGEMDSVFIDLDLWDARGEDLPPLGIKEPMIIAVDAGVTGDAFAIVPVTEHPDPERAGVLALRGAMIWMPKDFADGRIDFHLPERRIRWLCDGGCPQGHPKGDKRIDRGDEECSHCAAEDFSAPPHNVLMVVYDPYQLEDMMQRFRDDGLSWCSPFNQNTDRLIADANFAQRARKATMVHNKSPVLREHIRNAKAKVRTGEDTQLRIVKRYERAKVDAVVAASMGLQRASEVLLGAGEGTVIQLP